MTGGTNLIWKKNLLDELTWDIQMYDRNTGCGLSLEIPAQWQLKTQDWIYQGKKKSL